MNSKLSLCLTTFNRQDALLETLRELVNQAQEYDVPIYVVDGGSSDNTVELVRVFARENYSQLWVINDDKYLRLDEGIAKAVNMAESEYVWLCSDDDILVPYALSTVINRLDEGFSAIYLNSSVYNEDFSKLYLERSNYIYQDVVFHPGEHEKFLLSIVPTYIGGMIVRRELWNRFESRVDAITPNPWWHHLAVFFNIIVGNPILFLEQPLVKTRQDVASYSPIMFQVYCYDYPRTIWELPEAYSDQAKLKMISKEKRGQVSAAIIAKGAGWIDKRTSIGLDGMRSPRKVILRAVRIAMPRLSCMIFAALWLGAKMIVSGEFRMFKPRTLSGLRQAMSLTWAVAPKYKDGQKELWQNFHM